MNTLNQPWYRELTRYHWFVLTVAALGWLFDTLDQQLFTFARVPAITELLRTSPDAPPPDAKIVSRYGANATSVFLLGWATGGLAFGILGDRIGRAKTMVLTILVYSAFTGLSALSRNVYDFAAYRFLTGLGVGGEFAVGVALVAEVMPDRARPHALGLLQALSAVGNISAALVGVFFTELEAANVVAQGWGWRWMFVVGTGPALLALVIRRRLKEPERWQAAAHEGVVAKQLGSFAELFGDPRWRRNALAGMALAFAGVVGLWGIGFFSPDLQRSIFRKTFEAQGMSPAEVNQQLGRWTALSLVLQNIGGFFGIYAYSRLTHRVGRKPAFVVSFLAAMASTMMVFWYMDSFADILWMIPVMGFCQLSLFGGYAIYFPELFPTRLRSTGTSFCYNVGRFVAAAGPYTLGTLTSVVFTAENGFTELPMRYAGVTMCSVFLIGLVALPFLPETKGQPLPE